MLLRNSPERGLEQLMKRYMGLVFAIVRARMPASPEEDIEECVSDIFFEFYENREKIQLEKGSIQTFLC